MDVKKTSKKDAAKDTLTVVALALPIALLVLTNRKKTNAVKTRSTDTTVA